MVREGRRHRAKLIAVTVAVVAAALGLLYVFRPVLPPPGPTAPVAESEPEESATAAEDAPQLSGTVVVRGAKRTVPRAEVRVVCDMLGDDAPRFTATDDDGEFAFDGLPAGPCRLTASATGYVVGGPSASAPIEVVLSDERPLGGVDLPLWEAAVVAGRVLAGEQAVEGATLTVLYSEAPGEDHEYSVSPESSTGEDGGFALVELGPGRIQILAEHDDYALAESEEIFLKPGDRVTDVVIRLAGGGDIAGVVVDADGRPVPDARVNLTGEGMRGRRRATTDRRGRFSFEGVAPGRVLMAARAHGYADGRGDVVVVAGETVDVTIELASRVGFGGVVLDPDGEPVGNAAIHVLAGGARLPAGHVPIRPRAYSDADGRFWINRAPGADSVCWATHPAHGPSERIGVPTDGTEMTLRLTAGGSLVGAVVDAAGEPVASFSVALHSFRPHDGGRARSGGLPRVSVRDPSGTFAFSGLAPGIYDLRVSAPGYPPAISRDHEVWAGSETDAGEIRLARGGAVVGRIIDAESGDPVAGARIRAAAARMMGMAGGGPRGMTDDEGYFRLEGLPGERLSLNIRARGYINKLESGVEVPEDGEWDLGTISLQPSDGGGGSHRMQYSGIGAVLSRRDGRIVIREVFEGSPSFDNGLEEGTEILTVNGEGTEELDLRRAVEMIRGESGSEVTLEVVRPGETYPETVRVERGDVTTPKNSRSLRRRPRPRPRPNVR